MTYIEIGRWLGESDPTTRRLMEQLLAEEEEHAEDLRSLLARIDYGQGPGPVRRATDPGLAPWLSRRG